jgi:hypothetical protein
MPNSTAYLVLFGWPLVVILLFRILPRPHALVWSILGGYLALPFGVGINPPLLPVLDKGLIPALAAAVMCVLGGSGRPETQAEPGPAAMPGPAPIAASGAAPARPAFTRQVVRRPPRAVADPVIVPGQPQLLRIPRLVPVLILLLVLAEILTVRTNGADYLVGPRRFQGLSWYDAASMILSTLVMILPFVLGLRYLGTPNQQGVLLRILGLCGLLYSLPTLVEVRLSPQLSRWIYGFLAQSFAQTVRDDSFRPVVFLQHGLWLALFLAMAALACFALWRYRKDAGARIGWLLAGAWVAGVLFLCSSLGAVFILVLLAPALLLLPVRLQVVLAALIALTVLTYPMLRGGGLIPVDRVYQVVAQISEDRAQSLKFRLNNEDVLLARANEKPLAGWGGYGRSRLHDPRTGESISTTDGMWIILMGESGWLGYVATFGLLTLPMFLLLWRYRLVLPDAASAGLCLILAANLIDMIPNATMTPLTWLIAGALAGRCRVTGLAPPETEKRPRLQNRREPGRPARPAVTAALVLALLAGAGAGGGGIARAQTPADLPAGRGLSDPTLAFGLSGIADSSPARPFLDLMKESRPFVAHDKKSWSAMSNADLTAGGWLDAGGWPKRIPPGMTAIGTIWSWGRGAEDPDFYRRADIYVLSYRGEGALRLDGDVEVLQADPGRMILRNRNGGTMSLDIAATDPGGTGNHIRDITLVPQRYAALHAAGAIFNPDWLALVEDARQLRFMDWMEVNGTTSARWEDRPLMGDASWMKQGVPVEVMVQLANQTGTEPWFTMPMGAEEAYIRNFATYVRDHLDPGLKIHVEYSNETWNWAFQQTQWLLEQGQAAWGAGDDRVYIDYNAMLATRSALIWRAVFGDAAGQRLDMVLGIQTGSSRNAIRLLTAPLWQERDPAGYVAPSSVFTSLAVTTYFGGQTVAKDAPRAALLAAIRSDPQAAAAELTGQLQDPAYPGSIPQIVKRWRESKAVAEQYGLALIAYEGGQHIQQSFRVKGISEEDMDLLTYFLTGYVRSADMAELYAALWAAWAEVGQGPFMQFTDVSAASKFGIWGLYQGLGDRNPRADLLADLNGRAASWFGDGGGPQYQQGMIRLAGDGGEMLPGTDRDDFLIGGAGPDVILPGRGRDAVAGGEGEDVLALSGAAGAYRLQPEAGMEADVWRLTGPDTSVRVTGIERFRFAEGIEKTREEMRHD